MNLFDKYKKRKEAFKNQLAKKGVAEKELEEDAELIKECFKCPKHKPVTNRVIDALKSIKNDIVYLLQIGEIEKARLYALNYRFIDDFIQIPDVILKAEREIRLEREEVVKKRKRKPIKGKHE